MPIAPDTVASSLEDFIRVQSNVVEDDTEFTRQVHLFDYGYVDSIGATETLVFLESEFHVKIPDELLFSERATTIDGLAEIVAELASRESK